MEGDQENPKRRDLEEKEEEGDFPVDGKLRVKLRIGQKAMKALAGESPEKKDHVCGECNKRFSSGKALGGHMSSVHVQANRDYSYKRKQLWRTAGGGKGSGDDHEEESGREYYRGKDGKITCYHCGKNFPSTKSLFGHMRCHPDRDWRGMDPPLPLIQQSTNRNNIFDDTKVVGEQEQEEEEEQVDLVRYLWSWSSTAKRGRSPIIKPEYSSSDEEKELREASQHLVSLVNGDSHHHHHLNSTQSPNLETLNPNLEIEKNGGLGLMSSKGKGRVIWESRSSSEDEDDYYSEERSNPNSKNLDSSSPNKKKKRILESKNNCDKFKCSTCNKCFSSHQALGGHRSSHNKFKINIHNAIDECINAVSGDENNAENDTNNNVANATSKLGIIDSGGVIHECSGCNKIFATARGLGGHKKCHSAAQSSQMQEVEGSSSSNPTNDDDQAQPKILDFDLNEIPDQTGMDQVD